MEDEFETLKPVERPAEMERWNAEDLREYKTRLLAEIERIEAILEGKDSMRSEADALFRATD